MEAFDISLLHGNEIIEEAIGQFAKSQSAEAFMGICMAIRARIDQEGHLLFPADVEEDEQGQRFNFKTLDVDGVPVMVAFTSLEEKHKGPPCGGISHYIDSMLEVLLQMRGIGGLMLNPWGESVCLGKEDIALILTPGAERFVQ